MRLLLCLLQILFLMWVSLIEHYWVILRERRSSTVTLAARPDGSTVLAAHVNVLMIAFTNRK
jgi:hypothetical protein